MFYTDSLCACFLYVLHLWHITLLKFALHSWQVPRSSVGRALYRESGPSQDGDPDTGNLPFFFFVFIFIFFFSMICFFFSRWFVPFPILFYDQGHKWSGLSLYTRLFTSLDWRRFSFTYWSVYPFPTLLRWGHISEHY